MALGRDKETVQNSINKAHISRCWLLEVQVVGLIDVSRPYQAAAAVRALSDELKSALVRNP